MLRRRSSITGLSASIRARIVGARRCAAAPAGELGENPRRLRAPLVRLGHAREETRDQSVEPLLEGARLLAFRLQHSRGPLTLCAESLDLRRQRVHPGPQVPLQRAPPLQSVAHLAKRIHLDASARRRFGRRHMSGQRARQDRQPAQEHGSDQPGAQRMYFAVPLPPAASLRPRREAASRRLVRFRCNGWGMARRLESAFAPRRCRRAMARPLSPLLFRHGGALTRFAGSSQIACAVENSVPSGIDFCVSGEPVDHSEDNQIEVVHALH